MRMSIKFIIGSWVVLLGLVGLMVYSAYSKLNPQSFIALLNEQAQKSYPGSKLEVGAVDYKFSLDFNLNLNNLVLTRGVDVLGEVREIELRVPWWLLLFNKGSAQINVNKLIIYVDHRKFSHEEGTAAATSPSPTVKVSLPDYLSRANYTLRAKDISVRELNGDRRYFTLSKLLVRELQYGKNSAFELNIPIEINHRSKKYTSELWLFGDLTPNYDRWRLNYRGELKTQETAEKFQFDDLVIDGSAHINPALLDVDSQFNFLIEKVPVGKGKFSAKLDELKVDFEFIKIPLTYLSLIGEEIKNPFWTHLDGTAKGELKFIRHLNQEGTADLNGKLSFDGAFALAPQVSYPGLWKLSFENTKWDTSFFSPKGEVTYFRRAFLDFKKGSVTQYSQEIGFSGIEMKLALLPIENLESFMNDKSQSFYTTLFSLRRCLEGDRPIDGQFRYGRSPDQKYYQTEISDGDGKLILNYQEKMAGHALDLELTRFPWRAHEKFLEPFFMLESGVLTGTVQGRWNQQWSDGQWNLKVKGDELKGLQGTLSEYGQKVLDNFELDQTTAPSMTWNASMAKQTLKVLPLALDGSEPIHINGTISADGKLKSSLVMTYPKNKKVKPVRKEVKEVFWKKETT